MEVLGSDQLEPEVTDLQFKNVGQVTRFVTKRHCRMQETLHRIEKAFQGISVSQVLCAGLTSCHSCQVQRIGKSQSPVQLRTSRRAAWAHEPPARGSRR